MLDLNCNKKLYINLKKENICCTLFVCTFVDAFFCHNEVIWIKLT